MALTQEDVRGIADYARIALGGDELAQMTDYLNDAVAMLEPILAYNVPDVAPTFHPIGDLSDVMRADEPAPARNLSREAALGNAASTRGESFRVPSILGEDEA